MPQKLHIQIHIVHGPWSLQISQSKNMYWPELNIFRHSSNGINQSFANLSTTFRLTFRLQIKKSSSINRIYSIYLLYTQIEPDDFANAPPAKKLLQNSLVLNQCFLESMLLHTCEWSPKGVKTGRVNGRALLATLDLHIKSFWTVLGDSEYSAAEL